MSRADSGGFDLVLAISIGYLQQRLTADLPTEAHTGFTYDRDSLCGLTSVFGKKVHAHLGLTAHLALTIDDVVVTPESDGASITVGATARARFGWDDVTLFEDDVIIGAGLHPKDTDFDPTPDDYLSLAVTLAGKLVADGDSLRVTGLTTTVTVPPGTLESIPPVAGLLWAMRIVHDEWANDLLAWLGQLPGAMAAAINALLPDALPAMPLPFADVRMSAIGSDLLALVTISGDPGDPRAITRSPIRRNADGSSRDPAGLVVANRLVLGAVREGLAELLGQAGFQPPHPCHWRGTTGIGGARGIPVQLTWVLGQIDQTGKLRLDLSLAGADASGGFGLSGTATVAAGVTVYPDRLELKVDPPTITHLDAWVAWWVYALMAVGGGPIAVAAMALVDALAEGELAEELNGLISSHMPTSFTVPLADFGLDPITRSAAQPDAEWQLANLTVPPAPPLLVPISRANDHILVLAEDGA